jgi:hypothetical protein
MAKTVTVETIPHFGIENISKGDDFPFYMRWKNAGVTNLNHIMDAVTKIS